MATILLAEDEQHIAEMIVFKLTNGGHQVIRAHDGDEAILLAEREIPDLVLLDVMMPALTGFEVLRRLKANPACRTIPVIMVTAKGQERDVVRGLQDGATDYIVKPFSLKELAARVELVLQRGPTPT